MANSLLSPTVILQEAGRLFHEQSKFISRINRQYDDRFAQSGAKVGYSIALRDRNAFTVTTGATMAVQDVAETSQTLTVNTQKHVAMNFVSADLTMVIDEFSDRYIKPAMAALVANMESDALISMRNKVGNFIDDDGTAFSYLDVAKSKQRLDETLTPPDQRYLLLCPTHATKYLDASKGFYNPSGKLGSQYGSGIVEDMTGYDIFSSVHAGPVHTTGTSVGGDTLWNVNGTTQDGTSIAVDTGSNTLKAGDIVTFAGCNAVHPETKADLGYLKTFAVAADFTATPLTLAGEGIIATGAKRNVTGYPTNAGAVSKLGSGTSASLTYVESLAFHKDAFIFGSADLEDMSRYGGWGARKNMDGISMRLWRQGDIVNDSAPCRIDVLYGFLARYTQMACRIHADG